MFVIACPNEFFDGRRYGVRFTEGRAMVENAALAELLVRELGYTDVTPKSSK